VNQINPLKQKIAQHFNVEYSGEDYVEDRFVTIKCPFVDHTTGKKKAGLNFHSGVLNCFGCQQAFSFAKVAEKIGIKLEEGELDSIEEMVEQLAPSKRITYPIKKQIAEYTKFLEEKQLTPEIVAKWKGEMIVDKEDKLYGYLRFQLSQGYCARRIIDSAKGLGDGERFYNKGTRTLLGFENLKSFETVILTEGITDFLTLQQCGYANSISSMGAKLSEAQAYLLRNKTVFILFDRDYAGYRGAIEASELLKKFKATAIILELPDIDGEKVDVNRLYGEDKPTLIAFLKTETTKYEQFDTSYLKKLKQNQYESLRFWKTSIESLDKALNGGVTTGIYGFTGDTGIGKTTIATTFLPSFVDQGANVLLCTYEVPKLQMWARIASRQSKYSFVELEREFHLLEDKIYQYTVIPLSNHLRIDNSPSIAQIEASIKKFDIIIIDYLQRMNPPFGVTDSNQAIAKNSAELSRLMMQYEKTIIILSSMSEGGTMFKGSGDPRYTNVANFVLHKLGEKTMSLKIEKNTRGKEGETIFLEPNYPHQFILEKEIGD
jgi:5S rRNA maturation endonuclease (ribonuclease M5)/archaellum biogenesis ATPase FlaH